jgi:RNA polymerase-associated protein CTR9
MALYSGAGVRLLVPVLDSNAVVAIGADQLPAEADDLLELLASEAAPLSTWFDFAKAYLSAGREDAFRHVCSEAVKEEVVAEVTRYFGRAPTYETTQFHCALAALNIAKGKEERNNAALKAEAFTAAAKSIQAARLLSPDEQMVSVAQGMLHLAKARWAGWCGWVFGARVYVCGGGGGGGGECSALC